MGRLLLSADADALKSLWFVDGRSVIEPQPDWIADANRFTRVIDELNEYFARHRQAFSVPLQPDGTEFQQRVWRELLQIPYGSTDSYGRIAHRLGNPAASRAVGLANGQNPISILIPCHRVIGANGKLTGYGGGLPIKQKLLELEQKQLALL